MDGGRNAKFKTSFSRLNPRTQNLPPRPYPPLTLALPVPFRSLPRTVCSRIVASLAATNLMYLMYLMYLMDLMDLMDLPPHRSRTHPIQYRCLQYATRVN